MHSRRWKKIGIKETGRRGNKTINEVATSGKSDVNIRDKDRQEEEKKETPLLGEKRKKKKRNGTPR